MRRLRRLSLLSLIVLTLTAPAALAQPTPDPMAELRNAAGQVVGLATFRQVGNAVQIRVEVAGLAPGRHGIHIHEGLICEPPDFTSAGGHLNPTGRQHGSRNPLGPHAGDLPNLDVGADGHGSLTATNAAVTLGPGPNSLLRPMGASLVVHAGPDDELTDPAGNSGARIACGRIVPGRLAAAATAPVRQIPRAGELPLPAPIALVGLALVAAGSLLRRR